MKPGTASQRLPEASSATRRPRNTDSCSPLRIGDPVRFPARGGVLHGHLLDPQGSRRFARVIDADDRIWKVPKTQLNPAAHRPRRDIIITPGNETRAAMRVGDPVTFQTPRGPMQGEIVKLNPARAKVRCRDSVWNVPYARLSRPDGARAGESRDRLRAIAAMARRLMDQHGLADWTLIFGESRRVLGQCNHRHRTIRIALRHALEHADTSIRDTVLHEIAHAIAGPDAGHGPGWKKIAQRIGATPNAKAYETEATNT